MQALRAFVLVAALGFAAAPVLADQTDPRLDALFESLKAAAGPDEAVEVQAEIWAIWLETEDAGAEALLLRGTRAMNGGRYEAALEAFDDLVEIAPDFAEGWNKRATLHYLMQNFERSLEDIDETLKREPRHFGALSGRGLVYVELDDLEKALAAFEEALAVSPQMPGPRINAEAIRRALKIRDI